MQPSERAPLAEFIRKMWLIQILNKPPITKYNRNYRLTHFHLRTHILYQIRYASQQRPIQLHTHTTVGSNIRVGKGNLPLCLSNIK
jgi:hypothetical protein